VDAPVETVGQRITRLRLANGWNQSELARRSGKSRSYIKQVEDGVFKPGSDSLPIFAVIFGITVDDLLNPSNTSGTINPVMPTTDLPPAVAAVVQRVGKYLNAERWANIAGYIEAKAEESREKTSAFGYHVEESQETPQEQPNQKTA